MQMNSRYFFRLFNYPQKRFQFDISTIFIKDWIKTLPKSLKNLYFPIFVIQWLWTVLIIRKIKESAIPWFQIAKCSDSWIGLSFMKSFFWVQENLNYQLVFENSNYINSTWKQFEVEIKSFVRFPLCKLLYFQFKQNSFSF